MLNQRYFLVTAVLMAVLAGSGCNQHYNGSLGFADSDSAVARTYYAHQASRERTLIQSEQSPTGRARLAAEGLTGPTARETVEISAVAQGLSTGGITPNYRGAETVDGQTEFVTDHEVAQPAGSGGLPGFYASLPGFEGEQSPMDSTGPVRRVSFTEEGGDFDVTTDPTGQWLVFGSTRHRQTADIYRQSVNGQAVTQLTDDPANDVMPAVSPDGNTIAFASDRGGNWDIYLMDAQGGPPIQLTNDSTHEIHPSFSPDGSELVYCSYGERSRQWQMVVININQPGTKRYIGHGLFPQWSPQGNTILFQRSRERGTRWFSVWTVTLNEQGEAGSPTEITWAPEAACITPQWSPDGNAVVFCMVRNGEADSQGRPVDSEVWLINADGTGRTRLTQGRFANLQPVWANSNVIYFVSNRGRQGVENIWAINSDQPAEFARSAGQEDGTATAEVPTETE